MCDGGRDRGNCCLSFEGTGGTYYRTYANVSAPRDEADPASVRGFKLDKYEVSLGRFRRFTSAWRKGWLPTGQFLYLLYRKTNIIPGTDASLVDYVPLHVINITDATTQFPI